MLCGGRSLENLRIFRYQAIQPSVLETRKGLGGSHASSAAAEEGCEKLVQVHILLGYHDIWILGP